VGCSLSGFDAFTDLRFEDRRVGGLSKTERRPHGGCGEDRGHKSQPLLDVYRGGRRVCQRNRQGYVTKVTSVSRNGNGVGIDKPNAIVSHYEAEYSDRSAASKRRLPMRNIAARLSCCATVLFLLFAVTPLTYGSNLVPLVDITGGGQAVEPLADAVAGWAFHVDTRITIGAIGLWDEGKLPLQIAHDIGLWKSDQTLLWVATVDNNSTPVPSIFAGGQWLFTDIPALQLQPGDYVLGAVWGDPNIGADPFRINTNIVTSGVSYTEACATFQLPDPELVFPDCGGGSLSNASYFGPNLAVVVPEPGSLALLACGIASAAGALRRRLNS
jgi:hypothetical protein